MANVAKVQKDDFSIMIFEHPKESPHHLECARASTGEYQRHGSVACAQPHAGIQSGKYKFFNKHDIALLGSTDRVTCNLEPEDELVPERVRERASTPPAASHTGNRMGKERRSARQTSSSTSPRTRSRPGRTSSSARSRSSFSFRTLRCSPSETTWSSSRSEGRDPRFIASTQARAEVSHHGEATYLRGGHYQTLGESDRQEGGKARLVWRSEKKVRPLPRKRWPRHSSSDKLVQHLKDIPDSPPTSCQRVGSSLKPPTTSGGR
jgi:hypothetical protein